MNPYAPYAAPQPPSAEVFTGYRQPAAMPHGPFGGDLRGHKPWVSWAFLGLMLLGSIAFISGVVLAASSDDLGDADLEETVSMIGGMLVLAGLAAYNIKVLLSLVWLHGAWSWIPPDQRITRNGKLVSPGNAVGFLFIPYFNLYWMFVANVGMCDALDRVRLPFRSASPAPRGLALAACICQVIPVVNLLVAPFFWFFYMRAVDKIRADVHRELGVVL